jgi:cytochrome c biogenesis protein ResB
MRTAILLLVAIAALGAVLQQQQQANALKTDVEQNRGRAPIAISGDNIFITW